MEFDFLDIGSEEPESYNTDQLVLKKLSYSGLGEFHGCPRKFQLDKLFTRTEEHYVENGGNVTFAYGHAVGEGMQQALLGKSRDEILWNMFIAWDADLLKEESRTKKSIAFAVVAIDKFLAYMQLSDLTEYEVATINGKLAVELSFRITLPDGFVYRGYIDVVLRHKVTGEIIVLELKTTGFTNIHEAQYKNSDQALGYTIVLDTALKDTTHHTSFDVRYLVYKTGAQEFEPFNFTKFFTQKVDWIQSILRDCDHITECITEGYFPKRGAHCYNFFKPCKHFNYCNMKDENLQLNTDLHETVIKGREEQFTLELNLLEIIEQMEEGNNAHGIS